MPEGPEILYTNIYLKKYLKNTQVETIKSYTDKPAIIPKDYIGIVEDIGCKGKLFWIKVSGKEKSSGSFVEPAVYFSFSKSSADTGTPVLY